MTMARNSRLPKIPCN